MRRMNSLGQWNFDFDVRLREISLLSVDFSLVPVLVNSLDQRDDVVFLKIESGDIQDGRNI